VRSLFSLLCHTQSHSLQPMSATNEREDLDWVRLYEEQTKNLAVCKEELSKRNPPVNPKDDDICNAIQSMVDVVDPKRVIFESYSIFKFPHDEVMRKCTGLHRSAPVLLVGDSAGVYLVLEDYSRRCVVYAEGFYANEKERRKVYRRKCKFFGGDDNAYKVITVGELVDLKPRATNRVDRSAPKVFLFKNNIHVLHDPALKIDDFV
jgi:hypothetical protein